MEALGHYILSVTSAAVLFGILQTLIAKNSMFHTLIRMIGGLFLTFTLIAPAVDIDLDRLLSIPFDFSQQGTAIAVQGKQISDVHFKDIIKDRCEAYILDKALYYQSHLEIEITLNEDEIPIPNAVRLQGQITPYAKSAMQEWIVKDIGIPRENQKWIG